MSTLDPLIDRLRRATRVTVLTGAGVSAASGVPTFRGAGGLWRQFRAIDLATADAFRRDPDLVWEWYQWRRAQIADCRPNDAHHVLATWSTRHRWRVVTQNVDDLHLKAGTKDLIRLHGSIWELSCWSQCGAGPWRDERPAIPLGELTCSACHGRARPAVVWFGEELRREDLAQASDAAVCDVFIAAGTSAVVYPAAGLVALASRHGAFTVEINPETTEASAIVGLSLQATAEAILPEIERRLQAR